MAEFLTSSLKELTDIVTGIRTEVLKNREEILKLQNNQGQGIYTGPSKPDFEKSNEVIKALIIQAEKKALISALRN